MGKWLARAASLGALLVCAGCSAEAPKLAAVHGKVFYKGAPLPCGTIVFAPDTVRGNSGPLAQAEIQPDGSYFLRTGDGPGAPVGWHRVTVVAVELPKSTPDERQFVVPRSLLPHKYRDPELSGLLCEVKAGQDNTIDFHLD